MRTYPINNDNITRKYRIIYKFPSHLQAQNLGKIAKISFYKRLNKNFRKVGRKFFSCLISLFLDCVIPTSFMTIDIQGEIDIIKVFLRLYSLIVKRRRIL